MVGERISVRALPSFRNTRCVATAALLAFAALAVRPSLVMGQEPTPPAAAPAPPAATPRAAPAQAIPTVPPAPRAAPAPAPSPSTAPTAPPTSMSDAANFNAATGGQFSSYGAAESAGGIDPMMLGDFLNASFKGSFNGVPLTAPAPIPQLFDLANPYQTHGFKVSEGQSIIPQDRAYTRFNYFSGVQDYNAQTYRATSGFEKTFLQGAASIGAQLPYNFIDQVPFAGNVGTFGQGTSANGLGDLSLITKFVLLDNPQTRSALSVGLAATAPTGHFTIGGVQPMFITRLHHYGTVQPWIGFLAYARPDGGAFVHSFNALDIPFDNNDVPLFYGDYGVGYYHIPRARGLITAIIPTFEAHVATVAGVNQVPVTLNRAVIPFLGNSPAVAQYATQLNMTLGSTFILRNRTALTLGAVTPTVGPRPFQYELQAQLNFFPGRGNRWIGPRGR